jgi:hypothetical protein
MVEDRKTRCEHHDILITYLPNSNARKIKIKQVMSSNTMIKVRSNEFSHVHQRLSSPLVLKKTDQSIISHFLSTLKNFNIKSSIKPIKVRLVHTRKKSHFIPLQEFFCYFTKYENP